LVVRPFGLAQGRLRTVVDEFEFNGLAIGDLAFRGGKDAASESRFLCACGASE